MEEFKPFLEWAKVVAGGLIGGIVVAYLSHKLTLHRERRSGRANRKKDFIVFMRTWQVEVGRTYLVSGGFEHRGSNFSDVVSTFVGQCELIRGDIPKEKGTEFNALVSAISSRRGGDLHVRGGHEKIDSAFEAIIALVASI